MNSVDKNGHALSQWVQKKSDQEAHCALCKKDIDISNGGVYQLQRHAEGTKHIRVAKTAIASGQSKLKIGSGGVYLSQASTSGASQKWTLSHQDKVTKAEAIWVMKVAQDNLSFRSCDKIAETFQEMFADSDVARDVKLNCSKVSYVVSHGLGSFFHEDLVTKIRNTSTFYAILLDETTNDQMKKQLDIHIRFWNDGLIDTRYLKSKMLGHATAQILRDTLSDALEEDGLDLKNMIMLGMDGPNVNKALWEKMDADCKAAGSHGLVDVGSCNIHTVHNAFGKAMGVLESWGIDSFLDQLFKFFHQTASRKEDYSQIQALMEVENHVLLRYVSNRWLSIGPVLERVIEQWKSLVEYFTVFLPKENVKLLISSQRYKDVRKQLCDLTLLRLHFLQYLTSAFNGFLTLFQSQEPLIHVLYSELSDLLKNILKKFLKCEVIKDKEGQDLLDTDIMKKDLMLSNDRIAIGESTRQLLPKKNITPLDKVGFFSDVKDAYAAVAKHLINRLPLDNSLLRRLRFLHPLMRQQEKSMDSIKAAARKFPHIFSDKDIDQIGDEWMLYQAENEINESWFMEEGGSYQRVDRYWARVLDVKTSTGKEKYPILGQFVKVVLAISHGQADVERGFSLNKYTVTSQRTHLSENAVNGLRTIKDAVTHNGKGEPCQVPVTKSMLESVRQAHRKYKADRDAKQEMEKQKLKKEAEEKEQQKAKDQMELQKTEEKKLREQKDRLLLDLKTADKLVAEANERLKKALASKSQRMVEICAAQALLESGHNKLSQTNSSLEKLEKKLSQCRKRKL